MASIDFLSLLNNIGTKRTKRVVQKRDEIQITRSDLNQFNNFIAARELTKKFMEVQAIASDVLRKSLYNKFISLAWENRRRPKNPKIRTTKNGDLDNTAIFQVKNDFNGLKQFYSEDNPTQAIIEALTNSGGIAALPRDVAERFVFDEISFEPEIIIRPITELSIGRVEGDEFIPSTPDEKSAVSKLILMLTAEPDSNGFVKVNGLTSKERDLIIQRETNIKIRDPEGLWKRIFKYAKNIYQFRRILEILKPVVLFSHAKFAISDTEPEKNSRLVEYTKTIFGED